MSQKNEILKNLTELIGKELFVSPDELSPSEKQIIDISAGIISSLDNDLADLQKKYRELEILFYEWAIMLINKYKVEFIQEIRKRKLKKINDAL